MLASSWALKLLSWTSHARASTANSSVSGFAALANAHATLASSCALQSATRRSIERANVAMRALIVPACPLLAAPCAMFASSRARISELVEAMCIVR